MLVRELTAGERLRIARRRERLSQAKMAKHHKMPLNAYKAAEADGETDWFLVPPSLGRLKPFEVYTLQRTRVGLTQPQLAARIGISTWWLCLMEQGKAPVETLAAYWTD